ncbi:MAG TPA: M6 family metalloprotease domain-containing protein [Tahibacter sp.]|nr:M6 family metalloprotease domain-containing protein [Tahibacter sp.]
MSTHDDNECRHSGCKAVWSDFCAVAPSPELKERLQKELALAKKNAKSPLMEALGIARTPRPLGFDDGVIIPPQQFPLGTPVSSIRAAAAERAPLRGQVRVIVVLAQFSDKPLGQTAQHFNDLFFSTGVLPHGSVREYYREVTGNLVDIVGEVVGPYQLPQTLAWYANGNYGIGKPSGTARANIMARDAAVAANPHVNFGPYDNDGNGYVDAFIVVHAGGGGEQTGNAGDIWSHKWTLPTAYSADGKQIFAYLTIPEDARIGVCAHELGHLLFGFPDLYDTDYTSEGVGNWCLMGGGSWNGGGDIPAHPSAWCKINQGWATVTNVTTGGTVSLTDVKASRNVHRLWKDGTGGSEYFLLENRQRSGFDAQLPADGLLIWHIDESQSGNTDENHYKVGLVQADGRRDLELDRNRGDAGDPYPGSGGNTAFNATSTPNSNSYAGQPTCVSVTGISASGATMSATVQVHCGKSVAKDSKDRKDLSKETIKEQVKEHTKDQKELSKDRKELLKDRKELVKEGTKEIKDRVDTKSVAKDASDRGKNPKEMAERPGGGGFGDFGPDFGGGVPDLEARLATIEAALGLGGAGEPFIGSELRPDLAGGPDYGGQSGSLQQRMAAGDRDAKAAFDSLPPT